LSLELVIGANVGGALTAIKEVEKRVSHLGDTLETLKAKALARQEFIKTEKDVAKILVLNKELQALELEIARVQNIGKAGFDSLGNAVVKNTNVIVNGSQKAFSAIRQLAFVLPGVGIAGILGFATSTIAGLFGIGEEAEKTSKKIEELNRSIESIQGAATAGVEEELSKVKALSKIVVDQTQSYQDRNAALNQLKEINKSYFGDLSVETAALGLLKTRVDEYTQALVNQAVIKGFTDQIGKLSVELFEQQQKLDELAAKKKKFDDQIAKGAPGIKTNIGKSTLAFAEQSKVVADLTFKMIDLNIAIEESVEKGLKFRPLKEPAKETKKDAEDIVARVKRIQQELRTINFVIPGELGITGLEDKATAERKAREFLKIINDRGRLGNFQARIPLDIDIPQTKANFEEKLNNPQLIFGGKDILKLKVALVIAADAEAQLKAQTDKLSKTLQSIGTNIAQSIGEGFASAVSGEGVKGFFSDLFAAVGAGLKQLGIQIIAISPLIQSLKLALKTLSPQGILLAGIGLVAAGALIEKAASKFATGGLVFGPTLGMVGEGSGTSRSNPEVIAPLDKLKNFIQPNVGAINIAGQFKISGNDLLLAIARNQNSQLRTT
jgi:hypothetical protein